MKISIHKRDPDKNGLRAIRLVYYYGSKTSEDGSRAQKRSYEPLNLFLYNKPKNAVEREHNKTTLQKVGAIRAKRLLEMESAKHGLDDSNKLNASFFDYFDRITASKASGNKSNLAGSVPRPLNGPHREDRICPRFWGQSKLLASGPLNNTQLRAGFLIFRAETLDEVQAMISTAPFAREDLIAQLDIQQWDPLFGQLDRYSSHNAASELLDLID